MGTYARHQVDAYPLQRSARDKSRPEPSTSYVNRRPLSTSGTRLLHQQDSQYLTSQGTDLILTAMAVDYCQPRRRLDNLTPPFQPLLAPTTSGCSTSAPSNAMYIYLSQRSSPVMCRLEPEKLDRPTQASEPTRPQHSDSSLPPTSNHTHHPPLLPTPESAPTPPKRDCLSKTP